MLPSSGKAMPADSVIYSLCWDWASGLLNCLDQFRMICESLILISNVVVVVELLSHVWLFVTPWTAAQQVSLSFTISQSLLKLMSIESVMPSNHLIFVVPFSFCLQSYPALGSFPMSQCFTSDGWNIEALASVLPMNIQGWYSLGLTGLISLHSKRLSSVISSTTIQRHQFFSTHPSLWSNSHIHTWRKVKVKSLCHVRLFATLWTVAHQAPPFMGFSRQEYCCGLPFPSPGDLPNPGIEPGSPTLQADALTSEPPGKPRKTSIPDYWKNRSFD